MSKAFKKENCWDLCICTHTSWYSNKFSWWLRRSENESDNHRINPAEWQVSIPAPKQVWVFEPATSLLLAHLACIFLLQLQLLFYAVQTNFPAMFGAIFSTAWQLMDHVLKVQVLWQTPHLRTSPHLRTCTPTFPSPAHTYFAIPPKDNDQHAKSLFKSYPARPYKAMGCMLSLYLRERQAVGLRCFISFDTKPSFQRV